MGRRKVREYKDLVDVAKTAADRAAGFLRGLTPAAAGPWVEKGRHDFVTEADRTAERLIAEALTEAVPGSTVVGEELTPGAARSARPGSTASSRLLALPDIAIALVHRRPPR